MLKRLMLKWNLISCEEQQRQKIAINPEWAEELKSYLKTPLPNLKARLCDLEMVAIDFETTGLNCNADHLLSIGMVPFTSSIIDVDRASEVFINHGQYVKAESAKVNELTPGMLESGISLDAAMEHFIKSIAGKVVVAHGAWIERSFIKTYLLETYQLTHFPCYFIDTLHIEKTWSFSGNHRIHKSYQLNDLRKHYGLPDYISHHAASDALSCAELFIVQCKKLTSVQDVRLEKFL